MKLKNYFKKLFSSLNRRKFYRGGIEHIQPNGIFGWVYCDNQKLDEVQLLYGSNLIAKAKIDTYRNDIARSFDFHGCSGFSIPLLSDEIPEFGKRLNPKVVVLNKKGNRKFEIKLLSQPQNTSDMIKTILNSEFKGFIGNFEGLDKFGNLKIIIKVPIYIKEFKIWIHSNKFKSFTLSSKNCKVTNDNDDWHFLNFEINSNEIALKDEDQFIWFSYDEKGMFIIPKDLSKFSEPKFQSIKLNASFIKDLDNNSQFKNNFHSLNKADFEENLEHIPPELRDDFIMVDNCKILLDTIENKILKAKRKRKNKNIFNKLIKILKD